MKALVVRLSFSEAHFRVHHTEVSPLSYPIPLPSTVVGIMGALLGWERESILEQARGWSFGALLLGLRGSIREFMKIVQFKSGQPKFPSPVETAELLVEPNYLLAMVGDNPLLEKCYLKLQKGYEYLPYGGRNEYFVKDIEIIGLDNVIVTRQVTSYAPINWVERIESHPGGWVRGLQVKHKIEDASDWFFFTYQNILHLNREVQTVQGIALYPIDWFYWGKPIRE